MSGVKIVFQNIPNNIAKKIGKLYAKKVSIGDKKLKEKFWLHMD
jgi:hypothetical protein